MKIGDTVHNAVWITGDEHPTMRADYERQVKESISYLCNENGYVHGDYRILELRPDSDLSKYLKEPGVPDHIQGSRVRLLVIEADVVDKMVLSSEGSFIAQLERGDLMKLRKITRDNFVKRHGYFPTDAQLDEIIEELGPDAALAAMRLH